LCVCPNDICAARVIGFITIVRMLVEIFKVHWVCTGLLTSVKKVREGGKKGEFVQGCSPQTRLNEVWPIMWQLFMFPLFWTTTMSSHCECLFQFFSSMKTKKFLYTFMRRGIFARPRFSHIIFSLSSYCTIWTNLADIFL
jgi:hypothetical protein